MNTEEVFALSLGIAAAVCLLLSFALPYRNGKITFGASSGVFGLFAVGLAVMNLLMPAPVAAEVSKPSVIMPAPGVRLLKFWDDGGWHYTQVPEGFELKTGGDGR